MSTNLRERLANTREELQLAAHRQDLDELERLLEVCEELDALIMLEEGQTSYGISALTAEAIHQDWVEEQKKAPGPATEPHIGALSNNIQRPKRPHWLCLLFMGIATGLILWLMFIIAFFL